MFSPRTYEVIRDDMLAYIRMQTKLTDYEIGSVTRSIVEAAALEDDEQYFQMVQLLDAFRLSTASGQDLDDRVEEFGIIRLQPASSAGNIYILNDLLITSFLDFDVALGATSLILEDSSEFPTSGFPVTIRIGEGTLNEEDVTVSANSTGTNTLTCSATTKTHSAGERVSLVTGADQALAPGIRAQVPATSSDAAVTVVTTEEGTLVAGNYRSTALSARAEIPGSSSNIGASRITEFVSSPPFDGAGVTNLASFGGGRDLETDADLRDRARAHIQSLSKGTVLALHQGVLGVADPVTGQRAVTANILESFVSDEVIVYVDDGTGFVPGSVSLARSTLTVAVVGPVATLTVTDASKFPMEGFVIASPENPAQSEILEYSGVSGNDLTLVSATAKLHDIGDEVALVDLVEDNAETGANFFQLANFPVVRDSVRVWIDDGGVGDPVAKTEITDFFLTRGNGALELTGGGVSAGSIIAASYTYNTGLLAQVQKVINGDPDDPSNFPGIRAAGINVVVETPIVRRVSVRLAIKAIAGVQEAGLIPQVQEAVEAYINSLGIGEDVIVAEIVERAMAVPGMYNVSVTLPTSDIVILENELPVPYSVAGESLVVAT